jgi:hypothetical protein
MVSYAASPDSQGSGPKLTCFRRRTSCVCEGNDTFPILCRLKRCASWLQLMEESPVPRDSPFGFRMISIAGPRIILLLSTRGCNTDFLPYLIPFPLNSSPIALPRACIKRRLNLVAQVNGRICILCEVTYVEAALIPGGKPVTFLTVRIPAGPSLRQREGIVPVETLWVFPMHRLPDIPTPVAIPTLSDTLKFAIAAFARFRDSSHEPIIRTQC